jgi:hypothetical protein
MLGKNYDGEIGTMDIVALNDIYCLTEIEVVPFQSALMFQAVNCHQYPKNLYQIKL